MHIGVFENDAQKPPTRTNMTQECTSNLTALTQTASLKISYMVIDLGVRSKLRCLCSRSRISLIMAFRYCKAHVCWTNAVEHSSPGRARPATLTRCHRVLWRDVVRRHFILLPRLPPLRPCSLRGLPTENCVWNFLDARNGLPSGHQLNNMCKGCWVRCRRLIGGCSR